MLNFCLGFSFDSFEFMVIISFNRTSSNVRIPPMAARGCEEEHGNREICSSCMYMDLISQNELFPKTLSKSDAGHKVYIPKQYEEIFFSPAFGFPSINDGAETRMDVTFYDTKDKKPWKVGFLKSADQRSHLTQWSDFARLKNLSKGDVITFYKLETNKGTFLMIGVQKEGFIFGEDFTTGP